MKNIFHIGLVDQVGHERLIQEQSFERRSGMVDHDRHGDDDGPSPRQKDEGSLLFPRQVKVVADPTKKPTSSVHLN